MTEAQKKKLMKLLKSFSHHDEDEYHEGGSIEDLHDQYEATSLVVENAKYDLAQDILAILEQKSER
jgi:hypothetical protein